MSENGEDKRKNEILIFQSIIVVLSLTISITILAFAILNFIHRKRAKSQGIRDKNCQKLVCHSQKTCCGFLHPKTNVCTRGHLNEQGYCKEDNKPGEVS